MLFGLSETALTAGVAGLLWVLSVSSWVVIVYKTWWIWRALQDVPAAQQAYWQTPDPVQAQQVLVMLDRQALLQPLVGAACASQPSSSAGLERRAHEAARRQRQVVQSLRQVCQQVQWGQPWLACVASVGAAGATSAPAGAGAAAGATRTW